MVPLILQKKMRKGFLPLRVTHLAGMGLMINTRQKSMNNWVCLSKEAAIRLFGICQQGARSLDAVLHTSQSNWTELRWYYSAGRQNLINSALTDLGVESVPSLVNGLPSLPYDPGQWSFFSACMSY